jgi:hypothetical protein
MTMGALSRPEKTLRDVAETPHDTQVSETLRDRVRALKEITALYRLERLTYLCFAIAAFIMVLVCLVVALTQEEHASTLWGAFGASGIIAASCSRVIVMWEKAVAIILQKQKGG